MASIDDGQAMALYEQGLSDREIAQQVGVHIISIFRWRKRNNLPPHFVTTRCLTYSAVLFAMREAKAAGYWRVYPAQLIAFLPDDNEVSRYTLSKYLNEMVERGVIIRHGERLGYSLASVGTIQSRIIDTAQQQRAVYAQILATRLNLSRTTIREYLDNLSEAGVLQENNGAYRVT